MRKYIFISLLFLVGCNHNQHIYPVSKIIYETSISTADTVPSPINISNQINYIKQSNPYNDVINSIRSNDYRFIGVNGYTVMFPGLSNFYKNYFLNYTNCKIIANTSDYIVSREHGELTKAAFQYAEKYNKRMALCSFFKIKKIKTKTRADKKKAEKELPKALGTGA